MKKKMATYRVPDFVLALNEDTITQPIKNKNGKEQRQWNINNNDSEKIKKRWQILMSSEIDLLVYKYAMGPINYMLLSLNDTLQ